MNLCPMKTFQRYAMNIMIRQVILNLLTSLFASDLFLLLSLDARINSNIPSVLCSVYIIPHYHILQFNVLDNYREFVSTLMMG